MERVISNYYGRKEKEKEEMQQILDIFKSNKEGDSDISYENTELKKSDSLSFLKEDAKFEGVFDNPYWNLNEIGREIKPLIFSNGKSQEDVVKEIVELIKAGEKVILLHGVCGSGKSAIALNVARALGKANVVVPVKALQRQYEEDYASNKYLIKKNGQKMKIAMITGRENHDSIIFPGSSCADPLLPENIKLTEKNYKKLLEYYQDNPLIQNKGNPTWKQMRRISVAPTNPYWSPILSADIELNQIKDAKKKKYMGCNEKEYIFYHRKPGCSYYDQYQAYLDSDVIIYNAAKYKSEMSIGRKPYANIDIIDEADEFLDSLYQQENINLTRFYSSLKQVQANTSRADEAKVKILELIELQEKNKRLLGINEDDIFKIAETKMLQIFNLLVSSEDLQSEILIDEMNYSYNVLESNLDEVFCTFSKDEEQNIYAHIVSTNLAGKFSEIMRKSKALVLMSGTLHSDSILKNIFGIEKYKRVEAENLNLGNIEIIKTGKEIDCKMANFTRKKHTRKEYLFALNSSLEKSVKPVLVHVNAFKDLPNENDDNIPPDNKIISSEMLIEMQKNDKTGMSVSIFKAGLKDTLFSTKCSRGVDFPGKTCNSIVFTKYPNPNVGDIFWKVMKENHPNYYWDFYKDKAWREFLQRIYRAIRSQNDHVYILSPDIRVLNAVRELQEMNSKA